MSFCLQYKSCVMIDALKLGECTVHRAGTSDGKRWWNLWFYVARETDGVAQDFCVPINPNGDYVDQGVGGRTWGFKKTGVGIWTVSPSINVLPPLPSEVLHERSSHMVYAGPQRDAPKSLWHQTPDVVYVPEGEPWQS